MLILRSPNLFFFKKKKANFWLLITPIIFFFFFWDEIIVALSIEINGFEFIIWTIDQDFCSFDYKAGASHKQRLALNLFLDCAVDGF